MSVDVHRLLNGRPAELLLSISEESYRQLEPALLDFERKTGLKVDPYSDLRLSNFDPLIQALDRQIKDAGPSVAMQLKDLLVGAREESWSVIFVGD